MIILVAIAIAGVILLAGTVWSTRRRHVSAPTRISRQADGFPHAL